MAYSIVQSVTGGDATGTSFTTFTLTISAIGVGNTGMGYVAWYQGSTGATSVSVKFGSNDTAVVPDAVTGDHEWLASYKLENITDAPTTVVFTFSGGSTNQGRYISVNFKEVSGGIDHLDGHAMQFQTTPGTGTDAITSGSITPNQSGDFLYAGTFDSNAAATTNVTAGTNYTLNNNNTTQGSAQPLLDEDQTYNSVSAVAGTFTNVSAASDWITGLMAFGLPPLMGQACL